MRLSITALRLLLCTGVLLCTASVTASRAAESPADHPLVDKVRRYHEARQHDDRETLRQLLSEDSRIWFETREGPGMRRSLGGGGPWAEWDRVFNARSSHDTPQVAGRSVTVLQTEMNDFYALLDRPPKRVRATYTFDANDRIEGTLIQGIEGPESSAGRFAEFKHWARENRPGLLVELMPNDEIVPGLENAHRWMAVLLEWRRKTGLAPVVVGSHGSRQQRTNAHASVRRAIAEANRAFSRAYVRGDVAAIATLYTEDAMLLAPGRVVNGRDAIQRYFTLPPNRKQLAHSLTTERLEIDGDTVIETGTWSSTSQVVDREPVTTSEKYLLIWKRQRDGSWRMQFDMWHRPQPSSR